MKSGISSSMHERNNLFLIIVFGEFVTGIISAASDIHEMTLVKGTFIMGSLLLAVGLWWLYFDLVANRLPKPTLSTTILWTWLNIPVMISITSMGAVLSFILKSENEQLFVLNNETRGIELLLLGSFFVYFICIWLLNRYLNISDTFLPISKVVNKIFPFISIAVLIFMVIPISISWILSVMLLLIIILVLTFTILYSRNCQAFD
ncbi:MAG: low temperature requirement protein A [Bacilli bacterium]